MAYVRPNVLMIICDQLNTGALGVYGNDSVITPNIDSMGEKGIVFENCYTNSPLCAPARASLMSGKLVSNNEVYDNGAEFRASFPTFLHCLRQNGYRTVLSGKAHFVGPDQLHGFEKRLTTDIYPADFIWTPDWKKGIYGNPGTGVRRLKLSGVCKNSRQLNHDNEVQFRALEFLREYALEDNNDPFFLNVSYTHPHDPFVITRKYWEMYSKNSELDFPHNGEIALEEHHPFNRWIQIHHEIDNYPPQEEDIIRSRRAYFGMVSYLDDLVGELINELKRLGMYRNTIIIFTSDHGEMLGEHGMWFKRTFYEESVKVPLIFLWPQYLKSNIIEENVSWIDLGPTILDLCRVENSTFTGGIDGNSFSCLFNGNEEQWHNEAVSEYLGEGTISPLVMVKKDNYKYVYVSGEQPLLFNLDTDPHELTNLTWQQSKCKIESEFEEYVHDRWQFDELKADVICSQERRRMINKSGQTGDRESWDYQPFFDASRRYVRGNNDPCFIPADDK